MEILFEQAPRGLVINGFNCSFIASQTIKSLAMVNFYFFLFFFTKTVANEWRDIYIGFDKN